MTTEDTSIRKPCLILIQGFLGAGKSTFSRALSENTGLLRLNADDLCCAPAFSREDDIQDWLKSYARAEICLWERADKSLSTGRGVLMDLGFWSLSSRNAARQWAAERGYPVALVWIDGERDFLRNRIAERTGLVAESNKARFDQLWSQFEPPLPNENAFRLQAQEPTQQQVLRVLNRLGYQT